MSTINVPANWSPGFVWRRFVETLDEATGELTKKTQPTAIVTADACYLWVPRILKSTELSAFLADVRSYKPEFDVKVNSKTGTKHTPGQITSAEGVSYNGFYYNFGSSAFTESKVDIIW